MYAMRMLATDDQAWIKLKSFKAFIFYFA